MCALEDDMILALMALGWSQRFVLRLIHLARSSYYYRQHPRPPKPDPIPHTQRAYPNRLDEAETNTIVEALETSKVSVEQTYHRLFNAGVYTASLSTFYRLARRHKLRLPATRGRRLGGVKTTPITPRATAKKVGDVLCWDISYLPGLYKHRGFMLYTVIDLYSRYICAFTVQPRQDQTVAVDLMREAIETVPGPVGTIHCDNGAVMRSNKMAEFLQDQGIAQSFIRPGVSNDNAFMESFYRTLKYGPKYPGSFEDINTAYEWVAEFIEAYNTTHCHGGLNGYTPQDVFHGTWPLAWRKHQAALDAAYQAHPARYKHPPTATRPPATARINQATPHPLTTLTTQ